MSLFKRGKFWWYEFWFAGRRIQESPHATSKTIAKLAEQKRRRELEEGFNNVEDQRKEQIRPISDVAKEFLARYELRNRSVTFARYAVGHVVRLLGERMIVDISDLTVREYQDARLKEKASPKTINEEVGFLLRLIGDRGVIIRAQLKGKKALKLKGSRKVAKAFSTDEKERLIKAAGGARSPTIYPALMLALNAGLRNGEIRSLTWGQIDLEKRFLTVGKSKTEAGEGRTIPLNAGLFEALQHYRDWYLLRFGATPIEWYVFHLVGAKKLILAARSPQSRPRGRTHENAPV